jgi:hypothetical protein
LLCVGLTAICAAVWILPLQAIIGDFSDRGVRDALFATGIVVIPIFVSWAVEHAPSADD